MRHYDNGQIFYSPSDLVNFLGCRHASFLDVKALSEDIEAAEPSAIDRLLQQKGLQHETAYLERLKSAGKTVAEIPKGGSLKQRVALTREAMRSGVDVIYQAVLFVTPWRGDADFLIKCAAPPASAASESPKPAAPVAGSAVQQDHPPRGTPSERAAPPASSALGDFAYEVLDAKLARTPAPKHLVQLCLYSDLLATLQGARPANMHLLLGDGETRSFSVADYAHSTACARTRFEAFVRDLPAASNPEPCAHCSLCRWRDACNARWKEDDHLSLVANIRRSQRDKLRKAGIHTVAALAATDPKAKIPDLNRDVFKRLRAQAALQHHKATTGEDKHETIRAAPGKGFARMPAPDAGDLFFDMEGDPLYPDGLEYLFGVHYRAGGGGDDGDSDKASNESDGDGNANIGDVETRGGANAEGGSDDAGDGGANAKGGRDDANANADESRESRFKPFWAHDHDEEKAALGQFMRFVADHLAAHPRAHIYHYNHYETTALKRLACRYATCEEQLDNLLRGQKFVDLYKVVREGVRTSEPSYSLKNLETFYMDKRTGEVATAADSIVVYNEWRESGDDELLRRIADYNEDDCVSTRLLRNWLLALRPEDTPWFGQETDADAQAWQERKEWEIEYEDYQTRLDADDDPPPDAGNDNSPSSASGNAKGGSDDGASDNTPPSNASDNAPSPNANDDNPKLIRKRLSHLLEFHNREAKPQWWSMFDRKDKFTDELIDDAECLAGLTQRGEPQPEDRSLVYAYHFPVQDYKLKVGDKPVAITRFPDEFNIAGTITEIDDNARIAKIKRWSKLAALPPTLSLSPPTPIDCSAIRAAIYQYADHVLEADNADNAAHPATELLARNIPRIRGKRPGEAIITSDDLHADALAAVAGLDKSYLFIQGPPGAGKTHTCSHIIVELLKRGKRIGVTSNSHKAIHNLLEKIESVAAAKGVQFQGVKKATAGNKETLFDGQFIGSETSTKDMNLGADLFAGTVWTFAHKHFNCSPIEPLDYLFVDEAGQVATANVVAMAAATENIILVGDQMQLGQPIQGVHPGEAGLSVLEFLLGERATIPAERGIFLGQTWRMRPSICRFISDAFYDGRLTAHASATERELNLRGVGLPNEGIAMVVAKHDGCGQKCEEEGEIIEAKYEGLLGQEFVERGRARAITEDDILVVSPYNLQVNYLRSLLPKKARVGTVDKFQGQEAPIVLISMATSSVEYLSRDIGFLYSRNRLNVALSRAQCLAVMVASPRLLEAPCQNVGQMRLVNTFCRLSEYATQVS